MTSEIIWAGTPDDMTAISGEYVLRCEQMDRQLWWWCVYFQDEQIDQGMKNTADLAKSAAINAMKEHAKKEREEKCGDHYFLPSGGKYSPQGQKTCCHCGKTIGN